MASLKDKTRSFRRLLQACILIPGEVVAAQNDDGVTSIKVTDPDRPNRVYVKLYGQDERVVEAINVKVAAREKMPVLLRHMMTGEFVIAEGDPIAGTDLYEGAASSVFMPEMIGELMGVVWPARNLKPGRARLSELGGMNLYIEPFYHASGYFEGRNIDLTTYVPSTADTHLWAKVWYDPNTDTLGATVSAEYGLPYTLTDTELGNVIISSNYIPLAGVILTEGDTALSSTSTIVAAQNWISAPISTGSLWPITITDTRTIPDNAQVAVRRQTIGPGGVLTIAPGGVLDIF